MCVKHDILAALAYFDIFDYPLTQTEIYLFLRNSCSYKELRSAIYHLTNENLIYQFDEFYTLQNNYTLVSRRRRGNLKAKELIYTSEKVASLLSYFPFVRGVAISGSLSKNYADDKSDIDLFVITTKNRLWLARTLMHGFKKLTFLFNKQHLFCMNYYIDESMLQIKEQNIYTATEVATLLPLRGIDTFQNFYANNGWSKSFLPNHSLKVSYTKETPNPFFKKAVEYIFHNCIGSLLDCLLMNLTAKSWAQKTQKGKLNNRGIVMSMEAGRHCAKPNPQTFQNKLLDIYVRKVGTIIDKYDVGLKSIN